MEFFTRNLHIFIALIIAVILNVGILVYEGNVFPEFSIQRKWCDALFVTSVFYISAGLLSFVSQHGGFDALRYAFAKMIDRFKHPNPRDRADEETYYDYVRKKHSKDQRPVLYLIVIGGVMLAASIALLFAV